MQPYINFINPLKHIVFCESETNKQIDSKVERHASLNTANSDKCKDAQEYEPASQKKFLILLVQEDLQLWDPQRSIQRSGFLLTLQIPFSLQSERNQNHLTQLLTLIMAKLLKNAQIKISSSWNMMQTVKNKNRST